MAKIKDDEHEARNEIQQTLKRFYENKQNYPDTIFTLSDFIQSLPSNDDTNLKIRFKNYENSIFNNETDALNFTKQLSIINLDSILTDYNIASLTAMYIFHKLKNSAKNSATKKGFFCFIDELKDYLNEPTMREKILEAILEVRKIGGVICMGFQNISIFKDIPKSNSFLDNIANFIIFPTNNDLILNELAETISLNANEIAFLKNTNPNSRKILLKMPLRNESVILDIDLSRLNQHLKVFSSSSNDVNLMKKLKKENPTEFRNLYLQS